MGDKKEVNVSGDMDLSGDITFGNKVSGDSISAGRDVKVTHGDSFSIGSVGDGASVAQGAGSKIIGERGVNVEGSVHGNVVTGDGNLVSSGPAAEIETLLQQLVEAMNKNAAAAQKPEVKAVEQLAKQYAEQSKAPSPNKTLMEITGEGLKKAAENIKNVMPTVTTIALQMIAAGQKLLG